MTDEYLTRERAEGLLANFKRQLDDITPPKKRADVYLADMLKRDIRILEAKLSDTKDMVRERGKEKR